jgi:chemotaxis protein methyltransferase CheR
LQGREQGQTVQQTAMNEANVNPVLTDHEVRELQRLVEQRSGIVFDESRERFLTSRVIEHMQHRRLSFGVELLRLVRGSNVEYDIMLERLLTQETRFLRYPGMFLAFERHVVPEMHGRKFWDKDRKLRIWSAGCAGGEEPYSIALSIREAAGSGKELDASIMATDVSREALERGDRGVYAERMLENLSQMQIASYFTRCAEGYKVKPVLREMVQFAPMNLAEPVYLGRFDCIFCMNVLIYFGVELRNRLIRRFYESLEPGGYLFLGHAESAANAPVKFNQTIMNGARLLQKPLDSMTQAAGEGL